jgi:hypothetical protein
MNNLLTRLQNRFHRSELELEVDEELGHHVELLQREYMQGGMSPEEARAATLKRFGNVDRVRKECVAICRRSRPLQRAFKVGMILLALTGVIISMASTEFRVARIGHILIAIAVAGRLWFYLRSLGPSRFPANKTTSFSLLSGDHQTPAS